MSDDQLQNEFAMASHNLREPLRMMRCYVDLLIEQPEDNSDCIAPIQKSVDRMETLLNGMFECFQLSEYYKPKTVDMNLVYANAVTRLAEADRQVVSSGVLPSVPGDFDMLTEVMSRLMDNSLKFRGPRPPKIDWSAHRVDGHWHFGVQDQGIGIEPAYWERCFGMFKRLHSREVPGEGFGLTYCRRAVELHGGKIWLESVPKSGTTVHFTLPVAA